MKTITPVRIHRLCAGKFVGKLIRNGTTAQTKWKRMLTTLTPTQGLTPLDESCCKIRKNSLMSFLPNIIQFNNLRSRLSTAEGSWLRDVSRWRSCSQLGKHSNLSNYTTSDLLQNSQYRNHSFHHLLMCPASEFGYSFQAMYGTTKRVVKSKVPITTRSYS